MERLSNSASTVIQLWKPINLKTSEDGDDTFSEMLGQTSATQYKVPEGIGTTVKASKKTVFFD
jgi:hypothetical protein